MFPRPAATKIPEQKSIGDISKGAEKYSDISKNTLYTLDDAPFAADGDYTLTQSPAGFKLPFSQMGRTYH